MLDELLRAGQSIQDPRARRVYERAAVQTGLVESGLRNLNYGDADSKGWRQERASLYANPTDVRASAARFRDEFLQFYKPGMKSYDVAWRVQRPREDLRGRYREEADQAAAILARYAGGGASSGGGDVGTLGGGFVSGQQQSGQPAAMPDLGSAQSIAGTVASLMNQRRPVVASSSLAPPAHATGPALAGQTVQGGGGPAARPDVGALIDATRTPGQAAANIAASQSPLVAEASSEPRSRPATGTGGAQAALGWAESKIGFKEATGNNDGGLASYLNKRYGFNNAPWCAMFTSSAVTKGGAPAVARTASVEEVRRQAMQGGGGYRKGLIDGNKARPGDLILWGNRHIGMVESVKDGVIRYVAGNEGNAVARGTARVGTADIVRPLYGRR